MIAVMGGDGETARDIVDPAPSRLYTVRDIASRAVSRPSRNRAGTSRLRRRMPIGPADNAGRDHINS